MNVKVNHAKFAKVYFLSQMYAIYTFTFTVSIVYITSTTCYKMCPNNYVKFFGIRTNLERTTRLMVKKYDHSRNKQDA